MTKIAIGLKISTHEQRSVYPIKVGIDLVNRMKTLELALRSEDLKAQKVIKTAIFLFFAYFEEPTL
jgi:hypothetical protein